MKKILLIISLLSLFLILSSSVWAVTTIVDYPEIPGAKRPGQAEPGQELPRFIQYVFMFSLGIVGIIGMVAIVMGAFGYVTSAGNPQKAADAKSQIASALLGILLLLGSWVLLNLVNPDLLRLGVTTLELGEGSEIKGSYACYWCCKPLFPPGLTCDPHNKPVRWCVSNQTRAKTLEECKKEADFNCIEQFLPLFGGYRFDVVEVEKCK